MASITPSVILPISSFSAPLGSGTALRANSSTGSRAMHPARPFTRATSAQLVAAAMPARVQVGSRHAGSVWASRRAADQPAAASSAAAVIPRGKAAGASGSSRQRPKKSSTASGGTYQP